MVRVGAGVRVDDRGERLHPRVHRGPILRHTNDRINVYLEIPAGELPAGWAAHVIEQRADGIELDVLAGQYLRRQAIILGAKAQTSAKLWRYDLALFGAEAMTARGLWNSQADVVAVERTVARAAKASVFLVDASKLGASAPVFLMPWTDIDTLVTDATADTLAHAGISLPARSLVTC